MRYLVLLLTLLSVTAFSVTIESHLQFDGWPKEAERLPAIVTVTADSTDVVERDPIHVLYLLDVSSTFDAPFHDELISGAKMVMDKLSSKDLFGVVTYAEFARTLVPLTEMSGENKAKIIEQLSGVSKENGRNLSVALQKVESEFALKEGEKVADRVAIITNLGKISKGSEGDKILSELGESIEKIPYRVYTFSGGEKFDEDLMISCADRYKGRAFYAASDSIKLVQPQFLQMAMAISQTQMTTVTLTLTTSDATLYPFKDSTPLPERIELGTLAKGEKRHLFLEFGNRPSEDGSVDLEVAYFDVPTKSNLSITGLDEIDLLKETNGYLKSDVPLIIHSILYNLVESSGDLARGDKEFRKNYAYQFKEKLLYRLEALKNRLGGAEIEEAYTFLKTLYEEIGTGTVDIEIIIKKSKYELHNTKFGR